MSFDFTGLDVWPATTDWHWNCKLKLGSKTVFHSKQFHSNSVCLSKESPASALDWTVFHVNCRSTPLDKKTMHILFDWHSTFMAQLLESKTWLGKVLIWNMDHWPWPQALYLYYLIDSNKAKETWTLVSIWFEGPRVSCCLLFSVSVVANCFTGLCIGDLFQLLWLKVLKQCQIIFKCCQWLN